MSDLHGESLVNEIFMSQTIHTFHDMREDVRCAIYELERSSLFEFDDIVEETKKLKELNTSLPDLLEGFDVGDMLKIDAVIEKLPAESSLSSEEKKFTESVTDLLHRMEPLRKKCRDVRVLAESTLSDVTDIHSEKIDLNREDEVMYLPEFVDALERVHNCVTHVNELCETVYSQAARIGEAKE